MSSRSCPREPGGGGGVGAGAGKMLLVAVCAGRWAVAEAPAGFGGLRRRLRGEAGLTQEELAEAAGLSVRAVAYLERGAVTSPQKETVRLLAGALRLVGPARTEFEAAARGRAAPGGVAAA